MENIVNFKVNNEFCICQMCTKIFLILFYLATCKLFILKLNMSDKNDV